MEKYFGKNFINDLWRKCDWFMWLIYSWRKIYKHRNGENDNDYWMETKLAINWIWMNKYIYMLIFLSPKPINGYQCYTITLCREIRRTGSGEKFSHGNKLVSLVSGKSWIFIWKVGFDASRTTNWRYVLVLFLLIFSVT